MFAIVCVARCVWGGEMILGRQAVTRFATHEPSLRSEIWPFPSSSYSPPFPPFTSSLPLLIFHLLLLQRYFAEPITNSRILIFSSQKVFDLLLIAESVANLETRYNPAGTFLSHCSTIFLELGHSNTILRTSAVCIPCHHGWTHNLNL